MPQLKIFPVIINDWAPFICFVAGYNKKQALAFARETFPSLEDMAGDLNVLEPINMKHGKSFVVDPELCILETNEELYFWVGETSMYYEPGFESTKKASNLDRLLDDALQVAKSEDKNEIKLLPTSSDSNISGDNSDDKVDDKSSNRNITTNPDKSTNKNSKETALKDATVWV